MLPVMERLRDAARRLGRHVVLAEPSDPRVLEAARLLVSGGLARVSLIGLRDGEPDDGLTWVDPEEPALREQQAERLFQRRRERGMTREEAHRLAAQPLYCAALLVAAGVADAGVAGSVATTADVLRAGLHAIGTVPGRGLVSSFFLMQLASGRVVTFADCAVVPQPDAQQLGEIAVAAASSHQRLTGEEPRVALLSFSTHGSARHPDADKVRAAVELARRLAPNLALDGELQFDAAFDPATARRKAAGSAVAGQANVFVFPDLDAGNIGYKIAQRLGGAVAIGPIVQGLARPFMDLSRGCTPGEIADVATIACVLAESPAGVDPAVASDPEDQP